MKTTALAAALAALCSPALAGGLSPTPAAPVSVVAPSVSPRPATRDWTGFYAGIEAGTLGFEQTFEYDEGATGDEDTYLDASGAFYGLHAGYQRDFGRLVVGAEIAWDAAGASLDGTGSVFGDDRGVGALDSVGRAGLRLGFDAGRLLPYVTAGVAQATISYEEPMMERNAGTFGGRFVGVGVDYAVNDRLTVGVLALRHRFDHEVQLIGPFDGHDRLDTLAVRASWRF